MPFQIIRNNIIKVKADAIVNTANPKPVIGSGTDSAIYEAAGKTELLEERKKIGDIIPGQAVYTDAFHLDAKYIIHTVGPLWKDGQQGERELLRSCYANSLALAAELSCESIAFPMISTGTYGFPKEDALEIAITEISRFLLTSEMKVILVVFDRRALELSQRLIGDIEEYIDEHAVHLLREQEYSGSYGNRRARIEEERRVSEIHIPPPAFEYEEEKKLSTPDGSFSFGASLPDVSGKSLDEVLKNSEDTFQQRLFHLIDDRGLDDVTVYKRANIDRKVFSKIRCKEDYRPKKKTAIAFAIALELDMEETLDLLSRAEITFSPSSKFDLIVSYFITNKKYDIFEINMALFKYGQPILGE